MLELKPCKPEHIPRIQVFQELQQHQDMMVKDWYRSIIEDHLALSAWLGDECLGAAGVVQQLPHKAQAWSLLSCKSGPYMLDITRRVKAVMSGLSYPRIEMLVDADFQAGHRWAKMLGFTLECERHVAHGVFGNDEARYVRIKP